MRNTFYIHAKTKPEGHLCEALLVSGGGITIGIAILEHNAKGAPQSRNIAIYIYICKARQGYKLKNKVLFYMYAYIFSRNSTLRVSTYKHTI